MNLFARMVLIAVLTTSLQVLAVEMEEIVVQGKRIQSELLSASSIEVITADALENQRILNVEELTESVAGVNFAEFADGQYRLIYRGIGATGTSDNQNFSTAIDGVIVPYNRAFRLLDLEQVEVYRGPQGTLYGRNSNAGVVNVVTNKGDGPSDTRLSVSAGTDDTYSIRLATGGRPDGSDFFYRIAGRYEESDGAIENVILGIDDAHATEDYTLRGTLGWQGENWRVTGQVTYDKYDNNIDNLISVDTWEESIAPDLGVGDGEMIMPILTLEREIGLGTLKSITSFVRSERFFSLSAVLAPVLLSQDDSFDSFSQEIRLNGSTDRVDWVGGLYYLKERNRFTATRTLSTINLEFTYQDQTRRTDTIALFGEAEIELNSAWYLTLGLRVADESQDSDYRLARGAPEVDVSDDFTAVQPKVVLAYRPDDWGQVYISATRGFRAGGIFVTNPIDPTYDQEDVWQYELGLKGVFNEDRLELNTAVYYLDWTDVQIQRSIVASLDPFTTSTVVDNASSARTYGGEIDLLYRVSDRTHIGASYFVTNAKYEEFETYDRAGNFLDYSDNRVEFVPKNGYSAYFAYDFDNGLSVSVEAVNSGSYPMDSANSDTQDSYTVYNATIAYELDWGRVALVGRNISDEEYYTRGIPVAGIGTFGYPGNSRSITLEVSATFN